MTYIYACVYIYIYREREGFIVRLCYVSVEMRIRGRLRAIAERTRHPTLARLAARTSKEARFSLKRNNNKDTNKLIHTIKQT